jgi:hypothetical protein
VSVLLGWVCFIGIFVGILAFFYWDDHPAVQLKRKIKRRFKQESAAQTELDATFEKAKSDMERRANGWDRP